MQPPLDVMPGNDPSEPGATVALACRSVATLTERSDFIKASSGRRQGTTGFHLQALPRADQSGIRVGYTCSKKVGNAVARNRAKRRLREVARRVLPVHGRCGWDYVLVGRADMTATHDFALMQADLIRALTQVHRQPGQPVRP